MEQFENHQYINLETFKKDGAGVKTPLWFVERDGVLYMRTPMTTWKVKRIRNRAQVLLVPSDARGRPFGEWVAGEAKIYPAEEMAWVNEMTIQKYGLFKRLMDLMNRWRGNAGQMAVIEVHLN